MPRLLIVANCPSPNTQCLLDATAAGANDKAFEGIECRVLEPLDAGPDDVLWSDGLIVGSTENFGAMAGLIKDFFERIYYPCLEKTEAKPFAFYIKGGLDGQGAKTGIERIVTGLRWNAITEPLVLKGDYQPEFAERCRELGMTMAAGLDAGIY